jgi:hypothetical protein
MKHFQDCFNVWYLYVADFVLVPQILICTRVLAWRTADVWLARTPLAICETPFPLKLTSNVIYQLK